MKFSLHIFLCIGFCFGFVNNISAQDSLYNTPVDELNFLQYQVLGEDTMPVFTFDEFLVTSRYRTPEEEKAFKLLKRRIIKVYPYARRAVEMIDELDDITDNLDKKRHEKKYKKRLEKELKEQFTAELKKLSVGQGKVLIKLIERETGEPFYSTLKENKNGLTAFFYQNIGKRFGYDLKEGYDAEKYTDIEEIMNVIENYGVESLEMGYTQFPISKTLSAYQKLPDAETVIKKKNSKN